MEAQQYVSPPDVGALQAADAPDYCSISQAATLLGVSRVSIWRWIRDGRLSAVRVGHRTVRIARRDLEGELVRRTPAGALNGQAGGPRMPAGGATWEQAQRPGW